MDNKSKTSERSYFLNGSQVGDKPPDILTREHESFQKRLSRTLKGARRPASSKKELEQSIREAADEHEGSAGLGDLVASAFSNATDSVEGFNEKRTHGIGGANAAFQSGILAISRFAAAYSSILEAVSKASGPYAEIGYQTVSILLIAFVNKKKHDDIIEQHLSRIGRLFPRLERWKAIYEDRVMEDLVSETYHLGIRFARSVAEYFCHRWERVWLALNPVAMSRKFEEVAQSIYEALAEVNAEANQSLHARSQNIERLLRTRNADLEAELAGVRAELAASRIQQLKRDQQADDDNFRILEEGLNSNEIRSSHPCFDVSLAKTTLKRAFPNVKECSSAIPWSMHTLMTPERILSHPSFREWADLQSSALLFIHGETKREGRASTAAMPCWLSPAAIHIVEHITNSHDQSLQRDRIIYFSCRPDPENSIGKAASVLAMVALKLLSTRKDILRERLADFQSLTAARSPISSGKSSPSLSRPSNSPTWPLSPSSPGSWPWSRSDPSSPAGNGEHNTGMSHGALPMSMLTLEQCIFFLKEVLQELSKRDSTSLEDNAERKMTAYIVLDRIDYMEETVNLKKFLIELASLTKEMNSFRVKIVLVAEGRLQNNWNENLHEDLVDADKVFEVRMDQRELTTRDTATEKQQILWNTQ